MMETMETLTNEEILTDEEIKELSEDVMLFLSKMTALDNFIELLKDIDGYEEVRSIMDKLKRDSVGIISWYLLTV